MKNQPTTEVVVINLGFTLWTGSVKARPDEFGVDMSVLPDNVREEVLTFGRKYLFDPARLKKYNAFKVRAERLLAAHGERIDGGYVIPLTEVQEAVEGIEAIVREGEAAKAVDLEEFEGVQQEWKKRYPQYEAQLTGDTSLKARFDRQVQFRWTPYRVTAVYSDNPKLAAKLQDRFSSALEGTMGRLLSQASKVANQVYDALHKNLRVDFRTPGPLKTLAGKLRGLSFLDRRLQPLWQGILEVLSEMPISGPLSPTHIDRLDQLLMVLKDHRELVRRLDAGEEIVPPVTKSPVAVEETDVPAVRESATTPVPARNTSW